MSFGKLIEYKLTFKTKVSELEKLKLLLMIGIPKRHMFIFIMLKYIRLQKEIFVMEIIQGMEVLIPKALSQSSLP